MSTFLSASKHSPISASSTQALPQDLNVHKHPQPEGVCLVIAHGAPVYGMDTLLDGSLLTASMIGVVKSHLNDDAQIHHELIYTKKRLSSMPFALEARGDDLWIGTYRGVMRGTCVGGDVSMFSTSLEDLSTLDVSLSGDMVAVGGDDNRVLLFRADGERIWQGSTYKFPCRVRLDDTSLVVAGWNGMVFDAHLKDLPEMRDNGGWAGATAELQGVYVPDGGMPVFDALRMPDGRIIAVGVKDETQGFAVAWHAKAPHQAAASVVTQGGLHAIEHSPDGKWLAIGGNDQSVSILDSRDFSIKAQLNVALCVPEDESRAPFSAGVDYYEGSGAAAVFSLEWSHDGSSLFIGTQSGAVLEWSSAVFEP